MEYSEAAAGDDQGHEDQDQAVKVVPGRPALVRDLEREPRFSAVFMTDVMISAAALASCGPSHGRSSAYSASEVAVHTMPTPVNRMSWRITGNRRIPR